MHELSIAQELVRMAEEAARANGARKVREVRLRLGALSGVMEDALRLGYEAACRDTLLEGSRLVIEPAPVRIHCPRCGRDVEPEGLQLMYCPVCGAAGGTLVQGREIELAALEIEK